MNNKILLLIGALVIFFVENLLSVLSTFPLVFLPALIIFYLIDKNTDDSYLILIMSIVLLFDLSFGQTFGVMTGVTILVFLIIKLMANFVNFDNLKLPSVFLWTFLLVLFYLLLFNFMSLIFYEGIELASILSSGLILFGWLPIIALQIFITVLLLHLISNRNSKVKINQSRHHSSFLAS